MRGSVVLGFKGHRLFNRWQAHKGASPAGRQELLGEVTLVLFLISDQGVDVHQVHVEMPGKAENVQQLRGGQAGLGQLAGL